MNAHIQKAQGLHHCFSPLPWWPWIYVLLQESSDHPQGIALKVCSTSHEMLSFKKYHSLRRPESKTLLLLIFQTTNNRILLSPSSSLCSWILRFLFVLWKKIFPLRGNLLVIFQGILGLKSCYWLNRQEHYMIFYVNDDYQHYYSATFSN